MGCGQRRRQAVSGRREDDFHPPGISQRSGRSTRLALALPCQPFGGPFGDTAIFNAHGRGQCQRVTDGYASERVRTARFVPEDELKHLDPFLDFLGQPDKTQVENVVVNPLSSERSSIFATSFFAARGKKRAFFRIMCNALMSPCARSALIFPRQDRRPRSAAPDAQLGPAGVIQVAARR